MQENHNKKQALSSSISKKQIKENWLKLKNRMLGTNSKQGFLIQLLIYLLLITIGFIYLYPLIYMLSTSFKSLNDLLDTSIKWLPSGFYSKNYQQAFSVMNIKESLLGSIIISLVPTFFQVISTGLVGYGFAKYQFPFKKTLMFLMIFSFIIPPQILMMPTYVLYNDLGLLGSLNSFILPALFGQGIKSTIFVLIFYQFFKQTPVSLYEAAEVDGASEWTIFFRIGIPMAVPAIIIVFLFSFVWYWNETYLVNLYLGNGSGSRNWTTMLTQLQSFKSNYEALYPVTESGSNKLNEGVTMAGTMITLIPLLLTYFVLQNYFVESVDRSGITGE
ncbi:MAG TPA: carbohydrate ABC transporter permease [Candidatus Enterococcus avicola]|uniref:Carbohydrate ABC transporter permease n=1 Tax=Candidatus Enterococcus avicola TaxID=2838561 RepID=A0A9D2FA11_9ENTE|nr:carbohydrate ABC transporter permease [Candidatus Enterococcus avicola]